MVTCSPGTRTDYDRCRSSPTRRRRHPPGSRTGRLRCWSTVAARCWLEASGTRRGQPCGRGLLFGLALVAAAALIARFSSMRLQRMIAAMALPLVVGALLAGWSGIFLADRVSPFGLLFCDRVHLRGRRVCSGRGRIDERRRPGRRDGVDRRVCRDVCTAPGPGLRARLCALCSASDRRSGRGSVCTRRRYLRCHSRHPSSDSGV